MNTFEKSRGEVKPGARCLMLPAPFSGSAWDFAEVIAQGLSAEQPELLFLDGRPIPLPWWLVRAADGVGRPVFYGGLAENRRVEVHTHVPERYLLPLDPPDELRRELEEEEKLRIAGPRRHEVEREFAEVQRRYEELIKRSAS